MSERLKRLAPSLENTAPMALAFLLAILTQLPFGDGGGNVPAPHLTLMLVYYWSLHRPDCVPPIAVAALGLFQDLLWGGPPGLNMLVLLIVQIVLSNQQAVFTRQSFLVGWVGFLPVLAIVMPVSYAIASLYHMTLLPAGPLLGHAALSFAAYPLAGWLFGKIEHMLKRR